MTTTASAPLPLIGEDLATAYQEAYRARFRADVAAGERGPFLVPLYFIATHALPALYLALPHRRRPGLYRARWLVLALCAAGEWRFARYASSANFAAAYGVGVIAAWAFVWNCTLLLWTRPQWDAKRVQRLTLAQCRRKLELEQERQKQKLEEEEEEQQQLARRSNGAASENGKANGHRPSGATNGHAATNGKATNGHAANGHATNGFAKVNGDAAANGHGGNTNGLRNRTNNCTVNKENDESPAHGHAVSGDSDDVEEEFVYVWQEYPEDEPFLTRLSWALDITTSLRLTGQYFLPTQPLSCLLDPPRNPF